VERISSAEITITLFCRSATLVNAAVLLDNYFVYWQTAYMLDWRALQALSNDRRLKILGWLKDPRAHFRPQVDGDLVNDGVCAVLIAEKLGVSQPTLSEHMRIMSQANLVQSKRIKRWTFYKRNERCITEIKKSISSSL
jgi:DNA-binding transcriptional ArsR family regulator